MASLHKVCGFILALIISLSLNASAVLHPPVPIPSSFILTEADIFHTPEEPVVVNELPPELLRVFRDVASWIPIPPLTSDPAFSITCSGPLPDASLFPPGFSASYYKDLIHLCAFNIVMTKSNLDVPTDSISSLNLGCACRNPGLHEFVFCHAPPISSLVFASSHQLRDYCEAKCRCIVPPRPIGDSGGRRDIPIWTAGLHSAFLGEADGSLRFYVPATGGEGWNVQDYSADGDAATTFLSRLPDPSVADFSARVPLVGEVVQPKRQRGKQRKLEVGGREGSTCKGGCSRNWRCGAGCVCLSYALSVGVFQVVGCGSRRGSASLTRDWGPGHHGLGKRDQRGQEVWACPCNATYVSQACCGTVDGLVWEPPDGRLGGLHLDP